MSGGNAQKYSNAQKYENIVLIHKYKWQPSFIEQIITLKNKISVHKCFGKPKGIGII